MRWPPPSPTTTDPTSGSRILEGLRAAGADPEAPTLDDLAPVEHFHTRARGASLDLLRLAGLGPRDRVLDLGGGIGGGARLLAAEAGCRVTVLDLTEAYVEVGRDLTRRTGLEDRVDFVHGDALSAPFADGAFDAVWTQHSSMNIADKEASTPRRGGCCAPAGPWRSTRSWPARAARSTCPCPGRGSGPQPPSARRGGARDDRRPRLSRGRLGGPVGRLPGVQPRPRRGSASGDLPPLGLHLLLGDDYGAMVTNQVRNLEEDRIRIVMGVWRAA